MGADSTISNTGWRKGIIAWMEKILGRKFHWLICMLHTNELGLRKLMAELDGPTNSKTGFSGPLGKLWKRWKAVKTGILPREVVLYKSGPVVHSR